MNNPIYNSISALGTLVTNLVTGAVRFYRRYILFGIKNTFAKFIIYNKDSFKSAKTFVKIGSIVPSFAGTGKPV